MMFLSFARNSSCVPLSCGLDLGFILAPQNKIARFWHSPCRNLAISLHKNQQQSHVKMRFYSILNGGLARPKTHRLKPALPAPRGGLLQCNIARGDDCVDVDSNRIRYTPRIPARKGGSHGNPLTPRMFEY